MCGRYYVGENLIEKVQEAIGSTIAASTHVYCGDVTPGMKASVIANRNNKPVIEEMTWGFQKFDDKGLIINARAETAVEKRLFKECLDHRRILIPASAFYEWDKDKNKVTFSLTDVPFLLLAGFYQRTDDAPSGRFVILTTAANASMSPVHDRMPLIIGKDRVSLWLQNKDVANKMLTEEMPPLTSYRDYEQMSLFHS